MFGCWIIETSFQQRIGLKKLKNDPAGSLPGTRSVRSQLQIVRNPILFVSLSENRDRFDIALQNGRRPAMLVRDSGQPVPAVHPQWNSAPSLTIQSKPPPCEWQWKVRSQ